MANRAKPTFQAERFYQIPLELKSFTTGDFTQKYANKNCLSEISRNLTKDILFPHYIVS